MKVVGGMIFGLRGEGMRKVRTEEVFSAAHRLMNYEGDCGRLHGHNWRVEIEVRGFVDENGFLVDFRKLKDIVKRLDHKVILRYDDVLLEVLRKKGQAVVVMESNPTSEVIAGWICRQIRELSHRIVGVKVKVWETEKSYAEALWGVVI